MVTADPGLPQLPALLPSSYKGRVTLQHLTSHEPDGSCTVRLISGQTVALKADTNMDFEQLFPTQQNSNTMWLYSLFHLRVLGEALRQGHKHLRTTWEKGWQDATAHLNSSQGNHRISLGGAKLIGEVNP